MNNIKPGIYHAEVTDKSIRAVHVDQDALECAMLNHRIQQNINQQKATRRAQAEADRAYWERNQRLVACSAGFAAIVGILAGLVHIGAMASWLGAVGLVAAGVWLGHEFGK